MQGSSSSPDAAAAAQSTSSVHMLLAPFAVVKGVIRHLVIRVPWSSLESEPIHVQVSGVELVLGPLRARPFDAWEEQEREEAVKQQQLARYEEERQRRSHELASVWTSRSSSGASAGGEASEKGKMAATSDGATEDANASWFSWIWDFDRISQLALRNLCVTLKDVCARYEFDYEGLHPSLAKAFAFFVHEVRLTTVNQGFRETFVSELLAPLCKRILLSDIIVSVHTMRVPQPSSTESPSARASSSMRSSYFPSSVKLSRDDGGVSSSPVQDDDTSGSSSPLSVTHGQKSAYETYQDQWAFSKAILKISKMELQAKIVPPGCTSLHPIVEDAPPLPASSTELTISAVEGVQAEVCFGVFQTLESLWRSYHQSVGCARYRRRLHLLRVQRQQLPQQEQSVTSVDSSPERYASKSRESSSPLLSSETSTLRQLTRQRWQFALRCVLDDIQKQRQTFHRHDRSHREIIEGMMMFCQVRRAYCQYWKRMQGVRWALPLNELEEKKLMLMERQLSLMQVIFLRCLSYAEMLQEEDGYARQRAFIEEARQRSQKGVRGSRKQKADGRGGTGLWGWFTKAVISVPEKDDPSIASVSDAHCETLPMAVSPGLQVPSLTDLVRVEWELGERYTSPHRAPLVQPCVPQHFLPKATKGNSVYFTLRCIADTVTVRVAPTYWPLVHDSSVPPPPLNTPLRRIEQQFCGHLSSVEVFFTTVPDERPDKASWSFFVGSARFFFDGVLRSMLLRSKEAPEEDFIVVKQNASHTHVGVWIAPQLIICQPLHEWRWWGMEVAAFVEWFMALQRTFYAASPPARPDTTSSVLEEFPVGPHFAAPSGRASRPMSVQTTPTPRHSSQTSHDAVPSRESPLTRLLTPLIWNITIRATDVCIPLSGRDIDDTDADIIRLPPSEFPSLLVTDSMSTAVPAREGSLDGGTHKLSFAAEANAGAESELEALSHGATTRGGALHVFLYADESGGDKEGGGEEDQAAAISGSFVTSPAGSFASTKPVRCFLNNDACLVLSISTTRLVTAKSAQRRRRGGGNEYYLCIGDPDRAVRLFCQKKLSSTTLATNRHLELMSFAAGEVLLNSEELSVVFNQGIDFVVEPDAFAVLNDGLLKPAVFVASDPYARQAQALVEELHVLNAKDNGKPSHFPLHDAHQLPPLSWKLSTPGCMEVTRQDNETGQTDTDASPAMVVVREFPADCTRHILAAAIATLPKEAREGTIKDGEEEIAASVRNGVHNAAWESRIAGPSRGPFGGRTLALGISVARLLVRSAYDEDVAEVVLVAPEEVPAATASYRGALAALGAQEPRALELVWDPLSQQHPAGHDGLPAGLPFPQGGPKGCPAFLLSVPDVTMTTAAGQKLLTVEQLTVVQAATALPGAAENVAVTVEMASVCFHMVLVNLMEIAVGTFYALKLLATPQRTTGSEMQRDASEGVSSVAQPQQDATALEPSSLILSVEVRSIHLQAPLTKSDVQCAPYVEVNARLESFNALFEPALEEGDQKNEERGRRLHIQFEVPDAVQLVDYFGGDPETCSLVTALPWTAHQGRDSTADHPLRCAVDFAVPATLRVKGIEPATPAATTTTCNVDLRGGAIHAYFPLLYLFVDMLAHDERIQKLKRLPSSPLFQHGFTSLSHERVQRRTNSTAFSTVSTPESHSPMLQTTAAVASPSTPSSGRLEIAATLSDVDVFLATDAGVPVDTSNPDTFCVVRISEMKGGMVRTAAHSADPTICTPLRMRAYLDTVTLYLVDLMAAEPKNVRLPNLKVRVDAGVLLVPKETLTGYTYRRSNETDVTVIVGLHPPATTTEATASQHSNSAGKGTTMPEGRSAAAPSGETITTTAGVSMELGVYQFRSLVRFIIHNVAQAPVAAAQRCKERDVYEEAAHSLLHHRRCSLHPRQPASNSMEDVSRETPPPPPAAAPATSAALTLLVTLPPASLTVQEGDPAPASALESTNDVGTGSESISYEFTLRQGAQFYSASGGQWSNSPVKNGQISGLELKAHEDSVYTSASVARSSCGHVRSLLTADLVGVALVEGSSSSVLSASRSQGQEVDGEAVGVSSVNTPFLRIAAAVRNTTVRVPHVRWWLRLYSLFADSAGPTPRGSAPDIVPPAALSQHDSLADVGQPSPPQFRDSASSQQSSVLFGPRGGNRAGYPDGEQADWVAGGHPRPLTASQSSRWLYGFVELSQTQVMLGECDRGQQQQQPWCCLRIPDARLTVAPATLPQSAGVSRVYDEFTLDVARCPELLLRAADMAAAERSTTGFKVVYVSVLKLQPTAPAAREAEGNATGAFSGSSCIKVQLIRSPHSHLITKLRYGCCYRMTDLALHRTCALQVQLKGLLLNVPANELFGFAQELLRQSAEVGTLLTPENGPPRLASFHSAGPARTYTGVEAQLTNVGVVVSSESPPSPSEGPVTSQPHHNNEGGSPWCGVTVTSLRLTTDVELENVLTNTGDPATLMDDALAAGWRMRVWHLVSRITLRGVVLAGHHGVDVQWKMPVVELGVSQPLPRTVLCVRSNRYPDAGKDELSQQDGEISSSLLRQRSATDFFHVEPTAATVCSELNNHLLTRASIEVGEAGKKASDATPEKDVGVTAVPPVVISVDTVYTLSRSVAHLLTLWRAAEQRQLALASPRAGVVVTEEKPSNATSRPALLRRDESLGPIMWYEVKLSMCGRRVHLVSNLPVDALHGAARHCFMAIAVEDAITFQVDRVPHDDELVYASPRGNEELDRDRSMTSSDAAEAAGSAVVHEQYRVRVGTVRVCDGTGNLICLLTSQGSSRGATCDSHALTAEYARSERAMSVFAEHLLLTASPVTATFAVEWCRAYQAWSQLWLQAVRSAEPHERRCSGKDMGKENFFTASSFADVLVDVCQVDVLLAPAGYLAIKRSQLSRSLCAQEGPTTAVTGVNEVQVVRCDAVSLFSTSAVGCQYRRHECAPVLLACVTAPLLRRTRVSGTSATVCRVPSVSLFNRDRFSWALCTMRVTLIVRSATVLWSSTQIADFASQPPPAAEGEVQREAQKGVDAEVVTSLAEPSTYQLIVEKAEVLCFAPHDEHANAAPALHLRAEQVDVTAPAIVAASTSSSATESLKSEMSAQGKLSATYRCSSRATALPLLEETEVTLTVHTGVAPQRTASQVAVLEIQLCVAEKGLQLRVPANEDLECVVGALCLVVGQHVPRRSPTAVALQPSTGSTVVECHGGTSGGEDVPDAGKKGKEQQLWCLSVNVPRFSCDVILNPSGQRLAAVDVGHIYGRFKPRALGQRPYVELRVAELTGETDITEMETSSESVAAAARFMSMKPLASAPKQSAPTSYLSEWDAASTDMQQYALFLVQRSLPLSHEDWERRSSELCSCSDEASALTARVHAFHTHVSLTLLRALASDVLKPVVGGVRSASITDEIGAVVNSFHSTVLRVLQPNTPLPPPDELERHAALVRVVEVTSDWTLTHDLVLGGSTDGCNLQLHFCNTAPHNVITVRGSTAAAGQDEVVVHLSCCACVNGDQCPAIRVDPDVTVKFENVVVVVDGFGGPQGLLPSTFVVLGERALCVFPPTRQRSRLSLLSPHLLQSEHPAENALPNTEAEGRDQERAAAAASAQITPPWFATSIYSLDVKVDFDTSLAAQRRRLQAVGTWQLQYRFEDKRKGKQMIRTEREGGATLTLQRCANESCILTRTPVAFSARLGDANEEHRRLQIAFDMGATAWQLPLGHAQLLVRSVTSIINAFTHTPSAGATPSIAVAAPPGKRSGPTTEWEPPTSLDTQKNTKGSASSSFVTPPTPLDVECSVPLCTLCFTDDFQLPLAACNVENFSLKCAADMQFRDAVVSATASLSLIDHLERCSFPNGGHIRKSGGSTARVLFAAKPSMALVWTRFSSDSRSLSLSVSVEDVVTTLPITTALRVLRCARSDVESGTRAFWNDSGVELAVCAAGTCTSAPGQSTDLSGNGRHSQWRVPASPSERAIITGIPSAVAELTVTSPNPSDGAISPALSTDRCDSLHPGESLGVRLDLRRLRDDTVHRLRLTGYVSPFGALDVVVRKSVCGGIAVVHLASTVELTNAFYPLDGLVDGAAVVLRASSSFSSDVPAFVVAPRSTRFIPLPVLRDRFALEMGGCVYAAQAKFVTWAMVADAMTVMADQIVTSAATADAYASAARLRKLGVDAEKDADDGGSGNGHRGALSGGRQAQVVDSSTISFPVMLRPPHSHVTSSTATGTSLTEEESEAANRAAPPLLNRVVQLTWRRHRSQPQSQLLSSDCLPPCEYAVTVEPVWTLWNCTGCRLRLHLCLPAKGNAVSQKSAVKQHDEGEEKSSARAAATNVSAQDTEGDGNVIGAAVVENGMCFQWMPASLQHLEANVAAFFQLESPCTSSSSQWWSAAAPLFLKESPPSYIRLQQNATHTQGAVSLERRGSSVVVVRCAALLRSNMTQTVYLRDASRPMPLLGTDAQGRLNPQQLLPLFFSEYVTTLAPNAKRVGFTVRDTPLRATTADGKEETDPYYLTTPIAATVLSADERGDCTVFYSVSAAEDAGTEFVTSAVTSETLPGTSLWRPAAAAALQLRYLCCVRNADPHRTLCVRPYVRAGDTPVGAIEEIRIPPAEVRELRRFAAHTVEPEVQFCYGGKDAAPTPAHLWSPPVKLLSLATSTLPLVLKHVCAPPAPTTEPCADAFCLFSAPRGGHEPPFSTREHCRCLELQSSTADGRLCVSVSLRAVPPLRIVNRLNTTLQFTQTLAKGNKSASPASSPSAVRVSANAVSTALCSHTAPPWSYVVAAESNSFGCWEVPTLEFQGVRITLHSNRHKGFTASVDVDLLKCAAAPSAGLRVGQTDAYVYVNLDHVTHQFTVTVVATRQLESHMLCQPRRLTQLEVFVPRCTMYLSAVTVPMTGHFSGTSVIARSARGRLRTRARGEGTTALTVPSTATDEDVVALLRQLEVDVVCVRIVGVYGSATVTERRMLGSASVGIVEVLDATTPQAVYPVVFRMSSKTAQNIEGHPSSEDPTAARSDPSTTATASVGIHGGDSTSSLSSSTITAATAATVPRFKDPSWCNVEVQLARPDVGAGGTVMLPLQLLRITVPPMTLHLHDEFLFTVRTCAESVREELNSRLSTASSCGSAQFTRATASVKRTTGDLPCAAPQTVPSRSSTRRVYNVFLYQLHVSAIATEVTYTRSGDRCYNPFRNLGVLPAHLIPSIEGVDIKLKEVKLANVELLSATSFATVVQSFVWPLYRTQLLLQSYKVVGSLDALGNPRALLGSWSRGVWDLVTNSSGKSRWAGTRDFLRTTTSSTLHSVSALARSIGNLTGGSSTAATSASVAANGGSAGSITGGDGLLPSSDQRRGLLGEVFAEVSGGVVDAVAKPIRGAREGGVNGFLLGVASGMVGLVGRPVFGFFRGVGVTSQFYARLLDGQTTLTDEEARRLALGRNYRLSAAPTDSQDIKADAEGSLTVTAVTAVVADRCDVRLASLAFERMMSAVPRWRRSSESHVRAAVARAGVQNAALFLPYSTISAFFTPEEFATSLPTSLTAALTAKLLAALTHTQRSGNAGGGEEAADKGATLKRLARECDRASHIRASLGVPALHKYVADDVFVRVCSLDEIVESVTATGIQANYVILLSKAVNAAGEELFMP
ncbi:hypothetical protein ABB37_05069 [Leptomonas pyrrhocoris]|uniref:Chorein N-terminal domain-containing protein n=1 Tax=Leptomonas pyrrhocoris TaxID=157538 RepID=A0A0N0DVG4_LEPPY|nr:hypothetical protein ABB37_05069 [Leptomonas pyrrhocoris]KPA80054.1 hypothetical protein ABB37_05069 [Leptomonas pyrrhocoris]|eukprot:XP_015658493.1 hypothetical protein ABB37_05069 [Leptomonas pyrrhocoris]